MVFALHQLAASMGGAFPTYVVTQIPGWAIAALAGWVLYRWLEWPVWASVMLVAGWMAKDLLLYPMMRRFFQDQPAAQRMVGAAGTAATDLDPDGMVCVHGELWQARSDVTLHQGASIVVRDIEGLRLLVTAVAGPLP